MNRYLFILTILTFFTSCKKEDKEPVSPTSITYSFDLHFSNTSNRDFNYRIYDTEEDYFNDANPLLAIHVKAGTDTVVVFKAPRSSDFYFDSFDDSYTMSSWITFGTATLNHHLQTVQASVELNASGNGYRIRKVCLQGNRRRTYWHAVDAFNTATMVSAWQNMDDNRRHHRLTFDKNKTFTYITKGQMGNEVTRTGNYFLTSYYGVDGPEAINLEGTGYSVYNSAGAPGNLLSRASIDTILLSDGSLYWMMVRD